MANNIILKLFSKNIFVFAINVVASLAYFKSLIYFTDTKILADYFYIKALGMIIFFMFRVNFADVAFILKSNLNSSKEKILGTLILLYGLWAITLILCILFLNVLETELLNLIIMSFAFYIMNDSIEAYIGISRLFYNYKIIFYFRVLHLSKFLLFILFLSDHLTLKNVLIFELTFAFGLYIIIVLFHKKCLGTSLKKEYVYIKKNMNAIYGPWFQSLGKLSYDALPQALLANVVNDALFVEYNIVRKLLSIFNNAVQPLLQVFVAEAIKFKNSYSVYVKKYLLIIFPFSFIFVILASINYELLVTLLAKDIYAVPSLQLLLILAFTLFALYLMLFPIKQYFMLTEELKLLTLGFSTSSIFIAAISYFIIDAFESKGAVFIQGIGLSLPLILAYIFFLKFKKDQ